MPMAADHRNLDVARKAAQQLLQLDPNDAGTYVLLSNIYSSIEKWEESKRIRELMAKRKLNKPPGCRLTEVSGTVHEFVKG